MEFLDLVKIGSSVRVNVNSSKDRLSLKTLEIVKQSPSCLVKDFRLTDGKGIGVVVEFSSGEREWFFDNEIEVLDNSGNIIEIEDKSKNNLSPIKVFLDNFEYSTKNDINQLINPLNFFSWMIYSFKDIL